ncbi:peptidase S9 [Scytonema hofmannii PCC 7110]|uniref:Peptidase S9 n=2 Tax=Scytonema hofmannii TaxID=34078 RepID=A0A139XG99_9CYAN|nr:peptidase S9 [Scytonema hofmannii PCC 7110]
MGYAAISQENNQFQRLNVSASDTLNNNDLAKLPPLIDRKLFFADPQIANAQISPDGKFLAFQKPLNDVLNVWVKRLGEPFDAARPVTADTDSPILTYAWSEDGKYILYGQDKGGNENFHIYAVAPSAIPAQGSKAPPARDLTPLENIQARIYAVPEKTPNYIIVGLNDRNPQLHDVYRVNLTTGERELLIKNDRNVASWVADLEGNIRLAVRQTTDGGTEILRVENQGKTLVPVYTCSFEETCFPLRFHKDGDRVYVMTNKGNDVDLIRLVLFNPKTQQSKLVTADPQRRVDFGGAIFSEATDELIATYYVGDRLRIYPQNQEFARDLALLQTKLPEGDLFFDSATNDERLRLVKVESDVDPGSTYLFNRETGKVEKLYESRPKLPSKYLAPMRSIRYTARDGLEIPAYLTIPKGVEPRNLPVVVIPHGGPWARDTWGYNSYAQFLANRGYAVFQPNFRGSTGYGQAFLNAGNEEWGRGAMQHDITDGVKYLIQQGIADPERVGIFGISYGGYATLAGLAFTPKLYKAGISYVGPSNIITLINAIPPYWVPIKKTFMLRVGDPEDPEDRVRLRRQSPLFAAKQIQAPLLVIQGANDPRVKKVESDQIVVALRDLGRQVQYLVAPNEGHGFRREDNRLAVAAAVESFFARYLNGRAQESISPEVKARLEALTVDVEDVKAPQRPPKIEVGK